MPLRLLSGVMALMLAATAWAEGDTLTLKPEAYVKGPNVLLGDIAEITGDHAKPLAALEIAPAAMPGGSKNFDAAYLLSRIRSAGYSDADLKVTGARYVKATTLHLDVTHEMLAEDLRHFIQSEMPWKPEDATIDILTPEQDFVVPDGKVTFTWRPRPDYRYVGLGSFRGEVAVDGRLQKVVLCRANIEAYADVVVAVNELERGHIIVPGDVTLEKRSMAMAGENALRDLSAPVGYTARSAIFPGQVISKGDIVPRILVRRNQMVNVEMRSGTLDIKGVARAMNDAHEGDMVTCQNVQSKQQFQGVVRKDGVVVVP